MFVFVCVCLAIAILYYILYMSIDAIMSMLNSVCWIALKRASLAELAAYFLAVVFFFLATFFGLGVFGFFRLALLLVFFALAGVLFALAAGLAFLTVVAGSFLAAAAAAAAAVVGGFLAAAAAAAANLNEPLAPVPFVCTSVPLATPAFNAFLMNGASLQTSTLYMLAIFFLIALSDEPLRSFSALIAA